MRIKLPIFILLCVTLSCYGILEKLLADSLNVGGEILKHISYGNKYDSVQSNPNGQYSSSASYSYGGSIGGGTENLGIPSQTNNYQGLTQVIVQKTQLNNKGGLVPNFGFGGISHGNGFGGQLHDTILENYQQNNGFTDGEGYHSRVPQTGNFGLSLNFNLGSLFGQGHSTNGHHHGHKEHHGQVNFNSDFFHEITPNGNFNGHGQSYNENAEYERPEDTGNQNHGSQNLNQNVGYNNYEHIGNQNDQKPVYHETTYVTVPEVNINSPIENTHPSGLYNDNLGQNPVHNDRDEIANGGGGENVSDNERNEPSVFEPTESTKTPYENEKNSKVTTSNRKTTIKPETDQPLLVPLNINEYTYEGDKIQIASPKRNANEDNKKQEINTKEEEFDIDVRFNDDD